MPLGPLRFTNALGGTADFIYPGPSIDMQSPASAQAVDGTTYLIYAQSLDMSQWEISTGAYTALGGTFARTTVLANSLGTTAKINFGNPPQVFVIANTAVGAFSANKNGTDQTGIASGVDTKVTFSTLLFDPDSRFDTSLSRWTPPRGKVVITAALWMTGTWPAGTTPSCKLYKNGSLFKGGFTDGGLANDGTAFVSIVDNANGTDFYEVFAQQGTTAGTVTVKGNTTWTWFTGTAL